MGPCQADARSASLRENPFSRYPRACPARPLCPRIIQPAEGRAPHARKEGTGSSEARRHRLTATEAPILGNERPRHEYGLATRTRGAHPSGKTTARVVSGFSPQGHSCRAWPPRRGGLRTPATGLGLDRGMCPWVTRLRSAIPWKRNPSAHVRFSDAGAQSALLRENPLSSYPCPLPRKAIVPAPGRPWDVRAPSRPGEDLHPKVPGFTRHVQKPLAGKAPGRSRIVSKEGEALEGVTSELLWVT